MTHPKTWGPFTGRQLTTMVVALIAGVVMVPSAVWAVDTFSNVAVEDPVSGVKASVDASHHLFVAGGVTAVPRPPTTPLSFSEDVDNTKLARLVGPTTSQINLTALSVSPSPAGRTGSTDFYLYVGQEPTSSTTCSGSIAYTVFHIPSLQGAPTFVESFPTPLVIPVPTGKKVCLYGYAASNQETANGSGFLGK